jgi:hypothetical protein
VEGRAGPPRVIAAGGVDENDIGPAVQGSCGGEHGDLAACEEPGTYGAPATPGTTAWATSWPATVTTAPTQARSPARPGPASPGR